MVVAAGALALCTSGAGRADSALAEDLTGPDESSAKPGQTTATLRARARFYAHYEMIEPPDAASADSVQEVEIRRADLTLSGSLAGNWSYRFKGDMRTGELDIKDLMFDYDAGFATVSIGQIGPIDELVAPAYREFMEGANLEEAFAPDNQLGVYALRESKFWTAAVGAFKGALDPGKAEKGWTWSARITFAPPVPDGWLLHIGGYLSRRKGKAGEAVYGYSARSLLRTGERFVATDPVADRDRLFGLELVAGSGPVSLESQCAMVRASIVQPAASVSRFHGCYAALLWSLTGETRNYGDGGFSQIKVRSPVSAGGPGAWQAGVRFDSLDLDDGVISGGTQRGWSFALNWYLGDSLWLSTNYSRTTLDNGVGEWEAMDGAAVRLHYQVLW